MSILKGDRVELKSGETGEVIETWGISRLYMRVRKESDGKTIPVMDSEVAAKLPKAPTWGRR